MRYLLMFGSALAVLFSTAVQAKTSQVDRYNALVMSGNRAAMAGDFDRAIVNWQTAIPLDPSPNRRCRGVWLRNAIRAAHDTQSMIRQGKLRLSQAPAWFNNHETELWLPNICNSN